jgi:hypothetical protein
MGVVFTTSPQQDIAYVNTADASAQTAPMVWNYALPSGSPTIKHVVNAALQAVAGADVEEVDVVDFTDRRRRNMPSGLC